MPLLVSGQIDQKVSISETAEKLTGIWLMQTFEKDSLRTEQSIEGKKYIEKTLIDNQIVETHIKEGLYVVKLTFDEYGSGNYQSYDRYQLKGGSTIEEIIMDQPVPQLKFKNGKILIVMTYMLGEGEEHIIELTENKLVLLSDNNVRRTFKKVN
jgi:hypothetical protein